jgi:hypothetical protein
LPFREPYLFFGGNTFEALQFCQILQEIFNGHAESVSFLIFSLNDISFSNNLIFLEFFLPVLSDGLSFVFFLFESQLVIIHPFALTYHGYCIFSDVMNSWAINGIVGVSVTGKTLVDIFLFVFNQ